MKKALILASSIFIVTLPSVSFAVGPGSGTESLYDLRIGKCRVQSLKVKYRLDSLMGEPTVAGSYKWKGDANCKLPYSTTLWLKVSDGGSMYGYVRLSPVVPKANRGYGYNTTGSPSWRKTICGYNGTKSVDCYDKRNAKHLWKNGSVVDVKVTW